MNALDLAVDALAAHRLTRLVTVDVVTQELRGKVIAHAYGADKPAADMDPRRAEYLRHLEEDTGDAILRRDWWDLAVQEDPDPPKLATLVTCRWCAGVWIAAGVTVARLVAPRPWRWVARALAVASAAALVAAIEDD